MNRFPVQIGRNSPIPAQFRGIEPGSGSTRLGVYVHVPFCSSRCGYCDFNTYTAAELGDSVRRDGFADVLAAEVGMAAASVGARTVDTVFVGGGTPTLLGADGLTRILDAIRGAFELAPDAEVTTEANPDSVDERRLADLRAGGFTRISFGMQSSAPGVLAVLDRTHTPGASVAAARAARRVGFEHVNLDLIYGTPGESDDDLRRSVTDVLEADVDHVSAYALIVEEGTPLARRVRRGEIAAPDDEVMADRYLLVDDLLTGAGFTWYEVSNWSRPGGECRHNLAYWHSDDWWGVGPGAHSHVDGVRWWNVKHPRTYAERLGADASPEQDREVLGPDERIVERVMLGLRLAEGLPLAALPVPERAEPEIESGLLVRAEAAADRLVLTRQGRLLADAVVRRLVA
ncbi:MAG: coproporphyrinogen III oxidase [Actinomycetales bacterium]|nr:coproporphyrinogen III oxidase [Actinomycetales bacterium]